MVAKSTGSTYPTLSVRKYPSGIGIHDPQFSLFHRFRTAFFIAQHDIDDFAASTAFAAPDYKSVVFHLRHPPDWLRRIASGRSNRPS